MVAMTVSYASKTFIALALSELPTKIITKLISFARVKHPNLLRQSVKKKFYNIFHRSNNFMFNQAEDQVPMVERLPVSIKDDNANLCFI